MNFCYVFIDIYLVKCFYIVFFCGLEFGCLVGGGIYNVVFIFMFYKFNVYDIRVMSSLVFD